MFVGVFQDAMTGMTGMIHDDVGHVTDGIHVTLPFLTSLVMLEM
jgi:hypothetical protein